MSISLINSVNTISASKSTAADSAQTTQSNSLSAMDSDQFMLLLLAELKNQNPLEPMNDKDMMAQMTQINSLQELKKINNGLETMAKSNQLTQAASLIGKTVEVAIDGKSNQSGEVTGVSLVQGQVMLWLKDTTVLLSSLITVKA